MPPSSAELHIPPDAEGDSTHPTLNSPEDSVQACFSTADSTHTSRVPEMTLKTPKNFEQSFAAFPTAATSDASAKSGDSQGSGSDGFSDILLSNVDIQWLQSTSQHLHQAQNLEELLKATVADVHQHFQVDRVLIYWFQTETQGVVVAESMINGYTPCLNEALPAIAFGAASPQDARQQIVALDNVAQSILSPYQQQLMAQLQTQASLSLPILLGEVWGLLVVQRCAHPKSWSDSDLTLLQKVVTELRLSLQVLEERTQQHRRVEQRKMFAKIVDKIHQPLDADNVDSVLRGATQDLRQQLQCDRVAVYRFITDEMGEFIAESVGQGWEPIARFSNLKNGLSAHLETAHFRAAYVNEAQDYQAGEALAIEDIHEARQHAFPIELLEQLATRAYAIAPILNGKTPWGLLVAYQNSGPRRWTLEELTLLTQVGQQMGVALHQASSLEKLQEQSDQIMEANERQRLMDYVVARIQQSPNLQRAFVNTCREVRRFLKSDRTAIYRFNVESGYSEGATIAEDVEPGYASVLEVSIQDHCFGESFVKEYEQGQIWRISDIQQPELEDCLVEILSRFQAKASLVVPLMKGNRLWGLFYNHQCSEPRTWTDEEVEFAKRVAAQLNTAIQQGEYIEELQRQSERLREKAEQERLITQIVDRIRQSLDLQQAFNTTTREIRGFLKADRVAIFKFEPGTGYNQGATIAEDVHPSYVSALQVRVEDHCFSQGFAQKYRNGHVSTINNVHESGIQQCYIDVLAQFQVQANLVVPLLQGEDLWGLFCIHQCEHPRKWQESEISFAKRIAAQLDIAIQQGSYIDELQNRTTQLSEAAEQEQLINQIVDRIRQSIELKQAFDTTTREIRGFLKADRVAVFKFEPDSGYSQGKTIAEDVRPGYVSALQVQVEDHCFSRGFAEKYRKGHVSTINDVYESGIQQCYIDVLAQFQVQANLVVPLLQGDDLWGLFCIHQCEHPREWQESEINFVKRIAAQLDIAIQQGSYVGELQQRSVQLSRAVAQNKAAKEQLQQQVIELLSAVRPALDGDLTVRAPVTESAVGTVADAYNNTLGSLRRLVIQMQEAASQVTQTSQASGAAIVTLADQAQGQFRALETALAELQVMAQTTQAVEMNAQQVNAAVQQANQTVLTGDAAIDRTVDEMQQIRGTVAETNKRLKRLGESSQKISKVVNLISNFTTQTQLLALNASIEATRAGEYGRGFAVVADEVRSLARQSAQAATDIEQLVQEIQASTSAVANAMEDGIARVASGTTVVNEARQSLNAIVTATDQISQLVFGITEATQTQTQQCQSVTQTMQDVAEIANQTSEDSVNISTAFQTLLTTAHDLQATSQRFRVNQS
ncbi:MAG: GAF domain-containing protein [Elainellaceae cyanobacterium]